MSLTLDGFWKGGLWAPTVWADGVWREGAVQEVAVQQVFVGDGPSWRDHLLAVHEKRTLERELALYGKSLKQVERKMVAAQRKVATVRKTTQNAQQIEGILSNLWKLAERKDRIEQKIRQVSVDYERIMMAASLQRQREADDEDDVEMLLES